MSVSVVRSSESIAETVIPRQMASVFYTTDSSYYTTLTRADVLGRVSGDNKRERCSILVFMPPA